MGMQWQGLVVADGRFAVKLADTNFCPPVEALSGLVHGASSVFVVRDSNGTACVMANFSAAFSTVYDTAGGPKNATFSLPSDAHVLNSSSCGKGGASDSILMIEFGGGHTLTLNFTRNATHYSVQLMSFVYNLSDVQIFPNASSKGTRTVESTPDIVAGMNTRYRCVSSSGVHMGSMTVTLWDATIQAYLSSSGFSKEELVGPLSAPGHATCGLGQRDSYHHPAETRCEQDKPSPVTPTAPPAPPRPSVSRYNVTDSNGTCLLATMGLQLNVTYSRKDNTTVTREFNVNPNKTTFSGSCTAQLVTLLLQGEDLALLAFQFGMNASSSQVFLQGIQLNMTLPDARGAPSTHSTAFADPTFRAANSSLRALQAAVGNSYKCNAEQRVQVTEAFSLNMFRVWVQAFQVDGDKFGPVEECQLDENSMLIPIAVGGALAGLVLIVLIAYLIGRKRSHAGYQTI
ncbi:Lysosome-associated membrane glycoprotein 1 [Camelus dromedarius]|uniref:Lysosome-associated membrane glycoprotein 1 n=1 Tax=Camelus dromedarius TaxID=9838 RepID=A0A5N4D9B9_CAMDR|nr:Lysosome-associated membrane glycoprotein 1 [Camelus dromedarius]